MSEFVWTEENLKFKDMKWKDFAPFNEISTVGKNAEEIVDACNYAFKQLPSSARCWEVLDAVSKEKKAGCKSNLSRKTKNWFLFVQNLITGEIKETRIDSFKENNKIIPIKKPKKQQIWKKNDPPEVKARKLAEWCKNNSESKFLLHPSVTKVNGNRDKVLFICKKHGNEHFIRIRGVINQFHGCKCFDSYAKFEKHKQDGVVPETLQLVPNQQWIDSYTPMQWIDPDGYEMFDSWNNVVNKKNWNSPNNPKYGSLIFEGYGKRAVQELGLWVVFQDTCNHLKNKGNLKYDIVVKDWNGKTILVIEMDGAQHYKYTPHFHRNGIEDFYWTKYRDWLKEELLKGRLWIDRKLYTTNKEGNPLQKIEMFIIKQTEYNSYEEVFEQISNHPIVKELLKQKEFNEMSFAEQQWVLANSLF